VATTILAVDDSATMRKILEITFAGTDFNLVAVSSGDEAAAKLRAGGVGLVICDNSLDADGYEVARQLKAAAGTVPVLFMSSRQNPYDSGKGSAARVDDHVDKPFDTQQLIDRCTKLASGGGAVAAAPPAAAPAPAARPAPAAAPAPAPAPAARPAPAPAAAAPKAAGFGGGGLGGPKPAAAAPAPAPAAAPAARPAPAAAPAAAVSAAATAANGQLASQLGGLGLTPQQADAVLALSREVIERVVWEVVPVLAETLIREEIARITK
jgi:CheY-like chemotaxis protein